MENKKNSKTTLSGNTKLYHIENKIRTSFLGKTRLYHTFRYWAKKRGIDKTIDYFTGHDISPTRRNQLKRLMKRAMIKYHWEFDEFFLFDFEHSSKEKIKQFVPEFEKNVFCDQVNNSEQADVFYDKWVTYEYFKDFFKRDVYNIRSFADIESEAFKGFVTAHPSFILKPVFEAKGKGIQILKTSGIDDAKDELTKIYTSGITAFIIEELVEQDEIMASFHPNSVNTIRIPTLRFNDRVEIIHPRIRLGRGNSIVDNAGAGGILGNIDTNTGVVYAACDKKGNQYSTHPDSNIEIIGFKVPRWNEAVETAKQLAQILPEVRYVGWDIALRPDGWVMIEGNDKGQFGFQYPNQEGFAEELEAYKKELLKN